MNHMRSVRKAAVVFTGLCLALASAGWSAQASAATLVVKPVLRQASDSGSTKTTQATQDTLIFKNQNVLVGTIVSETAEIVVFQGKVGGIDIKTEYKKSDILEIKRGIKVATPAAPEKPAEAANATDAAVVEPESGSTDEPQSESVPGHKRVYFMNLAGEFGAEISEIPIRNAIKDAARSNADVLVFKINNTWDFEGGGGKDKLPDAEGEFDIFRVEEILPILVDELPAALPNTRVVFWVDQAMGGAAFLPISCREIYFTSSGRLGGIGDLGEKYEGRGDEVVRQKLRAALLSHALGWGNRGGHDERIIRALCIKSYVLSVSYESGRPELFERMPLNPGEVLLTDDGKDANADLLADVAANKGNDVLTLRAKLAFDLGFSKGTADTKDELLFQLGIDRIADVIPEKRGEQVRKTFESQLGNAKKRLKQILNEIGRVEQGNNFNERTKNRGRKLTLLNEAIRLLNTVGTAITPRWMSENRIPDLAAFEQEKSSIEREQIADKPEKR